MKKVLLWNQRPRQPLSLHKLTRVCLPLWSVTSPWGMRLLTPPPHTGGGEPGLHRFYPQYAGQPSKRLSTTNPRLFPHWPWLPCEQSLARRPEKVRRERSPHGASAEWAEVSTLWLGVPSLLDEKLSNKTWIRCFSLSIPGDGAHTSGTFSTGLEKKLLRTSWLC